MRVRKINEFECSHCGQLVKTNVFFGSRFRNHCPYCLWSKHVGSGDKVRPCQGLMAPIGLTFKNEGWDKYNGKPKQGELMVIHQCQDCGTVSINRIAADDSAETILQIFKQSLKTKESIRQTLQKENIRLLTENDSREIKTQLFGRKD